MCFVADGYCTVSSSTVIRRSRKAHTCGDCFKTIPVGASYKSFFMVFEGDATTTKICQKCQSLRTAIIEIELLEGCARYEAEPLIGVMFEQLEGVGEHYHKKLIEQGKLNDADWLKENYHIPDEDCCDADS